MKRMDDLIQAITYRFGPDAELQREIARELRAHLEDAVAAARAEGKDEAQAEEAAVKAFGDPEEIAEKLWQANRRRMRLRAMAKWTGRLVLMPAGILLALWLCAATAEAIGVVFLSSDLLGYGHSGSFLWELLPQSLTNGWYLRLAARKGLNEDERAVQDADDSVEKWEQVVRRHPNDPMYLARRYALFLSKEASGEEAMLPGSAPTFDRGLTILDAGEKADPDNAFWNYMKADLLMLRSGAAKLEQGPSFTDTSADRGDAPYAGPGSRLIFNDRPMFERGVAEYRKGLTKAFYKSYAIEFLEKSLALRESPATLLDELRFIGEWASTLSPDLIPMRDMSRWMTAYSVLLIQEGRLHEAEDLIRSEPAAGAQIGANSRSLLELLTANSIRQTTLRQSAALYERLGRFQLAEQALTTARKEPQHEGQHLLSMEYGGEDMRFLNERAGFIGGQISSIAPLKDRSIFTDLQRAERFLAERAALGVLSLLYLMAVGWLGIQTLWSLWRHRKDTGGPKLYFIGWRRLGWIALIAIALPLMAYVILTRAFAFGSAHYGINYEPGRVALEMGGAVLLIFGLSLFLGWRAARKRCRDAGINDRAEFRTSVRRSLLPVLVACFLLMGVVSQAYLRYGESSAVKALSQPGRRPLLDQMDYITWKDYKDYLRTLPDHGALPADTTRH